MLTVNIDQLDSQLTQNGHAYETSVYTADILSVKMDLTLDHGLGIIFHTVVLEPLQTGNIRKDRPDRSNGSAGTDHVTVSPFAQNRGNSIDHNGFTCTGLTGKDIETAVKGNVRAFNNSNIFYMQQTQHSLSLPVISSAGF
jgi:hypothetical protein